MICFGLTVGFNARYFRCLGLFLEIVMEHK
jgi:hypothetical protein